VSPSQFFLANVYAERLAGTPVPAAPLPATSTARPAAPAPGQGGRRDDTAVAAGTR
jgi:hypothetical protein